MVMVNGILIDLITIVVCVPHMLREIVRRPSKDDKQNISDSSMQSRVPSSTTISGLYFNICRYHCRDRKSLDTNKHYKLLCTIQQIYLQIQATNDDNIIKCTKCCCNNQDVLLLRASDYNKASPKR